jgi:hypothetical protein
VTIVPVFDSTAPPSIDPGALAALVSTAASAERQLVSGYTSISWINMAAPMGLPLGLSGSVDLASAPGGAALANAHDAGQLPAGAVVVVVPPPGVTLTASGSLTCGGHFPFGDLAVDYVAPPSPSCPHGTDFYASHELAETFVNPALSAWSAQGEEAADLCFPLGFAYGGYTLSAVYQNWAGGGSGGCMGL